MFVDGLETRICKNGGVRTVKRGLVRRMNDAHAVNTESAYPIIILCMTLQLDTVILSGSLL